MATYKHIRSATANKRPTTSIADGQLAINTNTASPGLFFKDSAGTGIVKVGPVHVGTTAPNSTPAAGGSSGNYLGEQWLDTSVSPAQMKVWNGSAWIGVVADELPVSKLQDGAARQLIQTDAAGTGVEWTSNIDVPGTLDVTGASTLDSTLSVAGVSSFASGSAAAPSLTFTGDTNTGIYRPGADQVAISTNGVGRLFIDASGRVGIGTSPANDFDVVKTSSGATSTARIASTAPSGINNANLILDSGGSGSSTLRFDYEGSTNFASISSESSTKTLIFSTNATERLRITSDGKLGLGTSSPSSKLYVLGDASNYGITTEAPSGYGSVTFKQTSGNSISVGMLSNNLFVYDNAAGFTRLTLDSSGRLGIGTTSPNASLDVVGVGRFSGGSGYVSFGDNGFIRTDAANELRFQGGTSGTSFWKSGLSSESARIDNSGRLLVGTSTSRTGYKFETEGTASNNGWASFSHNSNDVVGAILKLLKSRGTAVGSNTIVQSGDIVGRIDFDGTDGSINQTAAQIYAVIDGTPGANDMPGRLVFSTTADGASSPTERMRITNTGYIFASGNESGSNVNRIAPVTDDVGYLGDSGHRWQAVYATNGTIQTSDEREKTDIQDSILGADFIRSLRPVSYRWKIGGYETTFDEDGNRVDTPVPGVRNHYGFIAQEVKQACGNADFGGWLLEDLDDPNSKQSLRLHEFISPMVKALQEALNEIDTLKAKVAALEAQ